MTTEDKKVLYELMKTWVATQLRGYAEDMDDSEVDEREAFHSLADDIVLDLATIKDWQSAMNIIGPF